MSLVLACYCANTPFTEREVGPGPNHATTSIISLLRLSVSGCTMSIAELLLVQAPIGIQNALVPLNYGDYCFSLF
jgi:hypothetical protein